MSRSSRMVPTCKNCIMCNESDTKGVKRKANAKKSKKCGNVAKVAQRKTCKKCNGSFASKQSLKAHLKLHDPNRELFPCDKCSKIFNTKGNLKEHYKHHFKSNKEFDAAWNTLDNRVVRQAGRSKNTVAATNQRVHVDDSSGDDSDDQESVSGSEESEEEFREEADDIEMENVAVDLDDGENENEFENEVEDNIDVNGDVDMNRLREFDDFDGNFIDQFPPPENVAEQDLEIEEPDHNDMEYIGEDDDSVEVLMRNEENEQENTDRVLQNLEFEQETLQPDNPLQFTEITTVTWFPQETDEQIAHSSNKTGHENLKALFQLMNEDRLSRNMGMEVVDKMVERSTSLSESTILNLLPTELKAECLEVIRKLQGNLQQNGSDFIEFLENFMKEMRSNNGNLEIIQFAEQLEEKCRLCPPRKREAEIIHIYKKVALRKSYTFKEFLEAAYFLPLNSTKCHCSYDVYNIKRVTPQGLYFVFLVDAWSPKYRIMNLTSNSIVDMFGSKWRVISFIECIPHPADSTKKGIYLNWNQSGLKWISTEVTFVAPMKKQIIAFKDHDVKALVFKKVSEQ